MSATGESNTTSFTPTFLSMCVSPLTIDSDNRQSDTNIPLLISLNNVKKFENRRMRLTVETIFEYCNCTWMVDAEFVGKPRKVLLQVQDWGELITYSKTHMVVFEPRKCRRDKSGENCKERGREMKLLLRGLTQV